MFKILLFIPFLSVIACSKNGNATTGNPVLYGVIFRDLFQKAVITNDMALVNLPYGSLVTAINTHIETDVSVKCSVAKDGDYNYIQPLVITLTDAGNTKKYYIKVNVANKPDTAVCGVWVTNVGSPALSSPQNIALMVNNIDAAGINVIFVDVFNKNQTLHPSAVLHNNILLGTQEQMFGAGWDPLQVLIEKAHAKNIKVIPWFEYGFISNYKGMAHPILDAHPDWVGVDYNYSATVRNDFTWFNAFNPAVQQFMLDLIMEVVNKYDVDGIQCDDHMPAMPINSGYDAATSDLYKKETGKDAPANTSDADWVQWRADKLTDFAERIYKTVKAAKPHCAIGFAPGPLGWAIQNNLADWEAWVRKGIYDMISPLLYKTESAGLSAYSGLVDKDVAQILNKYRGSVKKYFPGIMVKNAGYAPSDNYLASCVQYNRANGILGEVYWYYDGLISNTRVYKAFYPVKPIFPTY